MNEYELINALRGPGDLQLRAAEALERLLTERDKLATEMKRASEAREALERYREGLKHGEQDYDELQQAMELLGSSPAKFRIRKRKAMSRSELILRIDGLIENLDEVGSMVAKMANDRNATPQAQTNAKAILRVVEATKEEARSDIAPCSAAVSGIPAGKTEAVTDHCTLEEGHEGDHVGRSLRWPQEAAVA